MGSALLPRLDDAGHAVRLLDDFSGSSPRNLLGVDADYEFVRGSVTDRAAVERAVSGVDAVVHLAAITGAASTHDRREETFAVNLAGTENVLEAAESSGVDRVVLASSCNVYGDADATHLTETADPSPRNPYAESKLAAERALRAADVEGVALRPATNFGYSPGVRFNLVVNDFAFRAHAGDPLTIYGDGSNWRPFMHVRDTSRAFAEALDWPAGTYNVGYGNYRIEEVAEVVASAVGHPVDVEYLGDRDPGPSYHVDISKAFDAGFDPQYSLVEGVRDLLGRFSRG